MTKADLDDLYDILEVARKNNNQHVACLWAIAELSDKADSRAVDMMIQYFNIVALGERRST